MAKADKKAATEKTTTAEPEKTTTAEPGKGGQPVVDAELTIYAKLAYIQQQLKSPKDQFNDFGNYPYRSAEGIIEALKPYLGTLAVILGDEMVLVGNRIYVKSTAILTDGKNSVYSSAFARETETKKGMDEAQITGSASSYARKYALKGLFLIDDAEDSGDPDTVDNTNHVAAATQSISDEVMAILEMIDSNNVQAVHTNWKTLIGSNWHQLSEDIKERLNQMITEQH